ncbi:MAG: hypothetical protein C0425_05665 [Chlorobiaceae bacterium]|nr:hypothetical protein [Chlorobiaceae bacterium]MBA4309805.1 hypothetical protein [Chlorobiaceae bacterium]
MRNFRDTLTAKGYSHRWLELPEGHSWGLWRATTDFILEFIFPFGSTSVKNEIDSEPDFKLSQNYPNPFNPTTTISWQLPNDSYVSLVVYDMLGNEVVTLVNEEKKTGNYNIEFNAHDIASGIYFYKLTANKISGGKLGSFSETKKIILLK